MAAVSLHNAFLATDPSRRSSFRSEPPSPGSSSSHSPPNSRPFPTYGDSVHPTFASTVTYRQPPTHERDPPASTSQHSPPPSSLSHYRPSHDSIGRQTTEAHTAESHQALLSPRSREAFARDLNLERGQEQAREPAAGGGRESRPAVDIEGAGGLRTQGRRAVRRRRKTRWFRVVLEAVICLWTMYTVARYFIGSAIYTSHDRHTIAFILGASSSLSLLLFFLSVTLTYSDLSALSPHTSAYLITFFQYFASFFLLLPAIANFILVFVWHHTSDLGESLEGRCNWDLDVVWTGVGHTCQAGAATGWGVWLVLAVVRMVLTLGVLELYRFVWHLTRGPLSVVPSTLAVSAVHVPRRIRTTSQSHSHRSSFLPFLWNRSTSTMQTSPQPHNTPTDPSPGGQRMVSIAAAPVSVPRVRDPLLRATSSQSIVSGQGSGIGHIPIPDIPDSSTSPPRRPRKLSKRRSRRSARSQRVSFSGSTSGGSRPQSQAISHDSSAPASDHDQGNFTSSAEARHAAEGIGSVEGSGSPTPQPIAGPSSSPVPGLSHSPPGGLLASPSHGMSEGQLQELANQFRELVAQVTRETEAGMVLAQPDSPSPHSQDLRPRDPLYFPQSPASTPGSAQTSPNHTPSPSVDRESYFPSFPQSLAASTAIRAMDARGFRLANGEWVTYEEFGLLPPAELLRAPSPQSASSGASSILPGSGENVTGEDERIRILGAYIRRMPTIESFGSREASTRGARGPGSISTTQAGSLSRPPTRMTALSLTLSDVGTGGQGSPPPSRSNSLNIRQVLDAAGNPPSTANSSSSNADREPFPYSGNPDDPSGTVSGRDRSGSGGSTRSAISVVGTRSISTTYLTASPSPLASPVISEAHTRTSDGQASTTTTSTGSERHAVSLEPITEARGSSGDASVVGRAYPASMPP
ncbi:hypothetical protein PUNSTDRAFT_122501 [Punctularia strigosozonata HHB-11173 SS5]|uniref:Uncharacterized protein n=1 Tax=Punctularia strigosozonata (strain HHB-11173) TaxID=741275 RepID=R7S5F6_PUNST|nr:uncharacterized protein PUNSTDRAFT_122501 [Punctularia strigosozonata HHB-11173 SS5]EIN05172.1 hypothetical protein PUNSTDRAFT_122501 [Punctularia strigosozonata HHB-11173 SS5]